MDVSKGLYVCIKRTDVFYTLMDKPAKSEKYPVGEIFVGKSLVGE